MFEKNTVPFIRIFQSNIPVRPDLSCSSGQGHDFVLWWAWLGIIFPYYPGKENANSVPEGDMDNELPILAFLLHNAFARCR